MSCFLFFCCHWLIVLHCSFKMEPIVSSLCWFNLIIVLNTELLCSVSFASSTFGTMLCHLLSIFIDKALIAVVECGHYEFKGLLKCGTEKKTKSGKMSIHLWWQQTDVLYDKSGRIAYSLSQQAQQTATWPGGVLIDWASLMMGGSKPPLCITCCQGDKRRKEERRSARMQMQLAVRNI